MEVAIADYWVLFTIMLTVIGTGSILVGACNFHRQCRPCQLQRTRTDRQPEPPPDHCCPIAGTYGACNGAVKKRGLWTGKGHLTSKHKYFDNNFIGYAWGWYTLGLSWWISLKLCESDQLAVFLVQSCSVRRSASWTILVELYISKDSRMYKFNNFSESDKAFKVAIEHYADTDTELTNLDTQEYSHCTNNYICTHKLFTVLWA